MAKQNNEPVSSFRFLDLFSGIGGFHHALRSLGGRCVMACEIDDDARKVYRETFDPDGENFPLVDNIRHLTRSVIGPLLRRNAKTYRKLTLVEAGRLQGFPDHLYQKNPVSQKAAYKQLGNAVNVGMIQRVAGILLGIYQTPDGRR